MFATFDSGVIKDYDDIEGDLDMEYRIIERDSFKVIGKVFNISLKDGDHSIRISKLWEQCDADGTVEKIRGIDSRQNMLGLCMDFGIDMKVFRYMIAIEDVNNSAETGFDTVEIPATTWAVFTSIGPLPHAIINVWSRIFQVWFPASGFEHGNAPELEVYLPGNPSAQDYKCEVWTPIVKK